MSSEIAAAEQALYRAMIEQDFAALDAILSDDVVYIHSTAVAETKDGYLTGVRNGLYDYGSIQSDAVTVRFCGEVAVQTGKVRMVVGQGASLGAIGIAIGLSGAFALTHLLKTMLFGIGATDALNLDGGGSASLVHDGRLRNRPRAQRGADLLDGRPIVSAIVFEPR